MPRLDQLNYFNVSNANKQEGFKANSVNGSSFDKANFLFQHALQFNAEFQAKISYIFKRSGFRVYGSIKSNILRIAQKIRLNNGNLYQIDDMIRASVIVDENQ